MGRDTIVEGLAGVEGPLVQIPEWGGGLWDEWEGKGRLEVTFGGTTAGAVRETMKE